MNTLVLLFTLLSACLYGAAVWWPTFLWWGTFLSMVFAMRGWNESVGQRFVQGLLWGLIVYTMHLYGVVVGVVGLAAYYSWYAWIPGILLIIYLAVTTALIWALEAYIERLFQQCSIIYLRRMGRGVWMGLYWLWITYVCLWPLGRCEGYLLVNPLITLVQTPLMIVVSWCGVMGATLLLCIFSGLCTHLRIRTACKALVCALIFVWVFHFFMQSWHFDDLKKQPCALSIITKPIIASDNYAATCRLVGEYIAREHTQQRDLRGIVFPESCFYPWQVCAESLLANYLPAPLVGCDYIVGSFYNEHGLYRNSCYWLIDGVLQKRFDKRHAMPLIERLPYWFKNAKFAHLFFATMPEIVPSLNERPIMRLGTQVYVPYICSELFFNRVADDRYPKVPIVVLINDRWAKPYLQHLMYCGAIVQAYAWHREILYCSYTRFSRITPCTLEALNLF